MKTSNWSKVEDQFIRAKVAENVPMVDIAKQMGKTKNAVHLYCYRHHIHYKQTLENPLMRKLLEVKFSDPDYFKPNKAFFQKVKINQRRWSRLVAGYEQPTEDELRRVTIELRFDAEEFFKLLDARQLSLNL